MDPTYQESQAPPILQGDFVVPPPPSSWPKVFGVISIVFGALGALVNLWGTVAPLFLDAFAGMLPQDPASQASLQAQKDLAPLSMGSSALNLIGSILLLVGGIGLCLRGRWSVKALKIWIPWRMITAILSSIVGYMAMQASLNAMSQQQGGAGAAAMGQAMGVFFIALGLAWGWALPIVMFFWFRRRKIVEEVATWN